MVTSNKARTLGHLSTWQRVVERLSPTRDSYRPELHYMRGPGPKCREKRAHAFAGSAAHRSGATISTFVTDSFR